MDRHTFIGGSDLAPILGCSPYTSRRRLWLEKTRQVEPIDLSDNYHVRRGIRLEPMAKSLFVEWARARNPDGHVFGHIPEIPTHHKRRHDIGFAWAGGTPDLEWREPADYDAGIPQKLWVVDTKVVSADNYRLLTEQQLVPPLQYRCQLDWYMEIYDYTGGILFLYCPELDATHAMIVERDPVLGPLYLEEARLFWGHVTEMTDPGDGPMTPLPAPTPAATEDLTLVAATPEAIAALEEAIVNLHGAKQLAKQAQDLADAAKERVHDLLTRDGVHFTGTLLADGVRLSCSRVESRRLDADLLAEHAPLDRDRTLALCRALSETGAARFEPADLIACTLDLARVKSTSVSYTLRTSVIKPSNRVDHA